MSSTTTTSTTIPEMTEQEKQLMDMVSGSLLPAMLEEAGYNVDTTLVGWQDSDQYKKMNEELQKYQKMADSGRGAQWVQPSWGGPQRTAHDAAGDLQKRMKEAADSYTPAYKYDVEKMDAAMKQAADKYGKDSKQYAAAKESYQGQQVQNEKAMQDLRNTFMEKAQKYLNGDFSITDEQKALIKENLAPIKTAIDSMTKGSLDEAENTFKAFVKQVGETKMNVAAALDAVGSTIINTGKNMKESLGEVMTANRALMKMGIEDYSGKITKTMAQNAASLGRSPDDPEYQKEIQDSVAREFERGSLSLADMEARGEMGIAERTGAGLERVAQSRVALEEQTGGKLEGATTQLGQTRESLIYGQGKAKTDLASTEANMKWNVGAGMPPGQISTAIGVAGYNDAIAQQRLANASGAIGTTQGVYGTYANERYAQPTTTTTTPWNIADYLSVPMGVASMGANIYSGVTSANALNTMATDGGGPNPFAVLNG